MKKLMMAAVVAMLGIAANAAACSWEVDTVYSFVGPTAVSSSTATDYSTYFVNADAYSVSKATTAISGGDLTFLSDTTKAWAGDTLDDGYASGTAGVGVWGASETVNGYLVILNSDDIDNATYAYISSVESGTTSALGGNAQISFGDLDGSASGANWTAVPEPTSGLLLVVGGALLALRRRRLA